MTDWFRISGSPVKSARSSAGHAADIAGFEKELRQARAVNNRETRMTASERSHDDGSAYATPLERYCISHGNSEVFVEGSNDKSGSCDSTGCKASQQLAYQLRQELCAQLDLSGDQTLEDLASHSLDRYWTIDLSDLLDKKICLNLTRNQNGNWSATLDTTLEHDVDPVLEQLREHLLDLFDGNNGYAIVSSEQRTVIN